MTTLDLVPIAGVQPSNELRAAMREDLAVYGIAGYELIEGELRRVDPSTLVYRHGERAWYRRTSDGLEFFCSRLGK